MPELPEVETIRRDLEREIGGRRFKTVDIEEGRTVRREPTNKEEFAARLEGSKVVAVERMGKYLIVRTEGQWDLVIHLGMSGQLLKASAKDETIKHTRAVFGFQPTTQIRFVDPRTFGELFVTAADPETGIHPELAHLGIDPMRNSLSWEVFGAMLRAHRGKLKAVLTDQSFVAGIGNIYADEILFAAGLRYDRDVRSLTTQEVRRLWRSVGEVLGEAIKARGSSLADEQYVDLYHKLGKFQAAHNVYDRAGQRCHRCRGTIERVRWQQRSTYFCDSCQV